MPEKKLTITNQRGLHARASAKLVNLAGCFDAEVQLERDGEAVAATSIMGLMMLGASFGSVVILRTQGKDADSALAAIVALIENKFDEE
ncbi:MAG: HPr family phosphocarrier protein [Parvibaculales bacterium]